MQHSVYVGYKEYTLKSDKDKPYDYDTATINIRDKTTNQRNDYAGKYVLNGDGNPMLLAGILEVSGNFNYTFSSSHPPKGMTYTILAQYQDANGDVSTCASESKYVRAASTLTGYDFSNLGVTVYQTLKDAENQEGGVRVEGIPLIEKRLVVVLLLLQQILTCMYISTLMKEIHLLLHIMYHILEILYILMVILQKQSLLNLNL